MGIFKADNRQSELVDEMLKAESASHDGRVFTGKQVKILHGLLREVEGRDHQLALAQETEKALRERIAILEETLDVMRDALAAHQVTSQLHAAEGTVLMQELKQPAAR